VKIFWSWQSDTPGKTTRHFVKAALADAIKALKQPEEVEEPSERETREALHLDHDRQGIPGSPDLAPTIFEKIDGAAVVIADVTLVAELRDPKGRLLKKLINSNVAIEYGYAIRALGPTRVLMVQNLHYGNREQLPFDLKHKAGPLDYTLAPDASKDDMEAEHRRLRGVFISALRPYLESVRPSPKFDETQPTANIAFYWQPGEALAEHRSVMLPVLGQHDVDDSVQYRFNESRAFYLRLIPTSPLPEPLSIAKLQDVVSRHCIAVPTRTAFGSTSARNRYGAIAYEPHGNSTEPVGFTQIFRNGEIWSVTKELVAKYYDPPTIPMVNLKNIYNKIIRNFVEAAQKELGLSPPFQIEMGAIGLNGLRMSLPNNQGEFYNQLSEPIFEPEIRFRIVVNDPSASALESIVNSFIARMYDLAGITI
jgi:hypothetical protein